jgi:mono/diheme cytochrome c family protein
MPLILRTASRLLLLYAVALATPPTLAEEPDDHAKAGAVATLHQTGAANQRPTLAELKATGLERSRFKDHATRSVPPNGSTSATEAPQANLAHFESTIRPLLEQNCIDCHGPDTTEGNIRIDTLDPNLLTGADTDWWSEVFAVITKGEMPPPDYEPLSDDERRQLVDWLSLELQTASIVRRHSGSQSAFRRMTRYEYNYALQDLLGLPWDFAKDLPPEAHSEEGFENSSDLLHLSVSQFETYHRIARSALDRATATGDKPPTRYWGIAMKDAATQEWSKQDDKINEVKKKLKDDPEKLAAELERIQKSFRVPPRGAYYKELSSGRTAKAEWQYHGARYAFAPKEQPVAFPDDYDCVAILPNGFGPRLIVELGNQLPDEGTMRVRVRASRINTEGDRFPSLQLLFGWQASNEGRALLRASNEDTPVTASPDQPQIIQWDVPLGEIYPRNSVRKTSPMGATPSPSEYIRLVNSSASRSEIQIDFVQVAAPVFDQWPPESHRRIFGERDNCSDELADAREIISAFMRRAWRRPVSEEEIDFKLDLFTTMRPQCDTFDEAVVEVLATVLSSPRFLYVANTAGPKTTNDSIAGPPLDAHALANRLSLFLWCSIPDQKLLALADDGRLSDKDVLTSQVQRMLDDPRSERFAKHFVHQWLDMQLLEFMNFKQHIRGFDPLLKVAMQHEPVALFDQMLREDASVLDFIHCDYTMVNERLARHYGLSGVYGNHFRRVSLPEGIRRGGLLTQAGLLAMNSDWPDSHPLKRAIWLLECVLADPPPPPPPAVPQIDLADPEIAKMTLKERIADHRNHAACMSCHIKIDPWGIAFENYDALGQWRDEIKGKPVDVTSELFNHQTLDGMDGLKRFLLLNRQDQLVRAIVSKLATYALGRPLAFADRAEIDAITARVRRDGDGLRTAVEAIVQSELFRSM